MCETEVDFIRFLFLGEFTKTVWSVYFIMSLTSVASKCLMLRVSKAVQTVWRTARTLSLSRHPCKWIPMENSVLTLEKPHLRLLSPQITFPSTIWYTVQPFEQRHFCVAISPNARAVGSRRSGKPGRCHNYNSKWSRDTSIPPRATKKLVFCSLQLYPC